MCFKHGESICGFGVTENFLRTDIVDLNVFFRENPLNVKIRQFNDELEKRCFEKKLEKSRCGRKSIELIIPAA